MIVNNKPHQWKPNATVAAIIERDGRFLMIEEETPSGLRLNQPAGHLERGETLLQAVAREAWEESGWLFTPRGLTGIYLADAQHGDITYMRFAFHGDAVPPASPPRLDVGIVAVHWLAYEDISAQSARLRSPVVLQCLADYRNGIAYPLQLIRDLR
ncbi:NUDIX hydrolase [Chromobacterium phragmitis]|uniref:Phosphatase NudJ n=1 Tax=Chromobacterium phragmitis TaxID=2202141 RepID=A0A344UFU4_9NEIS|nr:NUDIX hydrolase [Chromobacterium phragmitis]AXE34142.1 NUDIX hydrolase [Chromobacterium phragmitis]